MTKESIGNGLRVLIVDDAASVRGLLKSVLSNQGYDVVGQLPSGKGVLEAVARLHPEIVCLDYVLPDCDGLQLLGQIVQEHPTVSVLMITGDTNPDLEEKAADLGAQGFLCKPFSLVQLQQDFAQVVRARQLLVQMQTASPARPSANRVKAVIADDSATMRSLLVSILENLGVEVVGQAADGRQAAEMVREHKANLVCLDWNMPVMNGLDALRLMVRSHPDLKALMITGRAEREAIISATQSGARGYILKPFHPEKVAATVKLLMHL